MIRATWAASVDTALESGAQMQILRTPMLVPTSPDDPASPANRAAWAALSDYHRPFLCAFSDSDPITRGADAVLAAHIPGARHHPPVTIEGAGHFLQEDKGEDLARVVADFISATR
jgi:haloalkane dehalogenase